MPNTKSAEKAMRVAERKRERNKSVRSETKTRITRAEAAIATRNTDQAKPKVNEAIRTIDKEVGKGTVHKNTAARRKSRLVKKLNKIVAPTNADTRA